MAASPLEEVGKKLDVARKELKARREKYEADAATLERAFEGERLVLEAIITGYAKMAEALGAPAPAPAPTMVVMEDDFEVHPIVAQPDPAPSASAPVASQTAPAVVTPTPTPAPAAPEKKKGNALQEFWAGFSGR